MKDRDLVRLYWPVDLRPAFDALTAIDDALAEIVASSTQPAIGAIRLAWWREALERLDRLPPPPEPRLRAAAEQLLTRGVTGEALAGLEDGYAAMLEEFHDPSRIAEFGSRYFVIGATVLGAQHPRLNEAGALYGEGAMRRRGAGPSHARTLGVRFPRRLRPLTMLATLAQRDLRAKSTMEAEATPGRALALIRHRLSGTL